jgi:16S rRNA (adenine1518-N6/adenine1519-N6)-dimethyltransferase
LARRVARRRVGPSGGEAIRARAQKRYGQHFLEPAWADRLVEAIGPQPSDVFLEIGPGPGALTLRLAKRVAHLTAVELDSAMVAVLAPQLPENVSLVPGDFLEFDIGSIAGSSIRVAGNLPYNAAAPILFKLLKASRDGRRLSDATLMVQREVADRIAAAPGSREYGTLSIFTQLRADIRRLLTLPPGAFRPVPKVHSTVLNLRFRNLPVELLDEGMFEAVVRSIFTQRRKTLVNALRPFATARGVEPRAAVERAGLDGTRRPETLQLTELARLADVFASV